MTSASEKVELPVLETLCPECGGRAGDTDRGHWRPCGRCNGSGYVPTEFGQRILALVRHNLRPMLEDTR